MLTTGTTKSVTQQPKTPTAPTRIDTGPNPDIDVRVSRPTNTALAVHIDGDLDDRTTPRVHQLLSRRMSSTAEAIILDLSEVRFLSVAGLELIDHLHRTATHNDTTVCLVDGPPCVDRALRATGWTRIPRYPTVAMATTEVTGRTRHDPIQPAYATAR